MIYQLPAFISDSFAIGSKSLNLVLLYHNIVHNNIFICNKLIARLIWNIIIKYQNKINILTKLTKNSSITIFDLNNKEINVNLDQLLKLPNYLNILHFNLSIIDLSILYSSINISYRIDWLSFNGRQIVEGIFLHHEAVMYFRKDSYYYSSSDDDDTNHDENDCDDDDHCGLSDDKDDSDNDDDDYDDDDDDNGYYDDIDKDRINLLSMYHSIDIDSISSNPAIFSINYEFLRNRIKDIKIKLSEKILQVF